MTRGLANFILPAVVFISAVGCENLPAPSADTPVTASPTTPLPSGSVVKGEITSQALAENLVGDPASRAYYVYLPPGYESGERRYPVIYYLHWFGGGPSTLALETASQMDQMIGSGRLRDVILVFPDGANRFIGSWYMSSPTIGDYETYISRELVGVIDSTYRTLAAPESRGIMGCSMGGTGALHLALRYPDVFGVSGVMSAYLVDVEHDPVWQAALRHYAREPRSFADLEQLDPSTRELISIAAVAAPNPARPPFYLDMPLSLEGNEAHIAPDVFEKASRLSPLGDIQPYLEQPARLRGLLIYADTAQGRSTEKMVFTTETSHRLDLALTNAGIEHTFVEVDAAHCEYGTTPIFEFMDSHLAY